MAIALADVLDVKNVDLALRTRSPENAFRKLIELLSANGRIADPEKFLEQVLEREQTSPSILEHGVAFPHARTDLVEEIVLAIGRSRAGVPFGIEGQRAHLIFLIGVPQRLVSDYLICVGALARIATNGETRMRLMQAATAEEFIAILNPPVLPAA